MKYGIKRWFGLATLGGVVACVSCLTLRWTVGGLPPEQQVAVPLGENRFVDTHAARPPGQEPATPQQRETLVRELADITALAKDVPVHSEQFPMEDLEALHRWASLTYVKAGTYLQDPSQLDRPIDNVPVELHTDGVSMKEVKQIRDLMKAYVLVYSDPRSTYSDYLRLRGGQEAVVTDPGRTAETCKAMRTILQNGYNVANPPDDILSILEKEWELNQKVNPYMDSVSFDLSFIAFHKQSAETWSPDQWGARPQEQSAVTVEALKRGSRESGNLFRMLENKVEPADVITKHGEIKYVDLSFSTGLKGQASYPVLIRYYYDPDSDRWLQAGVTPFFTKPIADEKIRHFLN